jgi:Transposase DDE domain
LHISAGLSLRQASVRASEQGLAQISDVALLKRLRSSGEWLQQLSSRLARQTWTRSSWPLLAQGYRLRAVDASNIQEPDATGTDWRLHYSLSLPALCCDHLELTDAHGGESLTRFPLQPKDLLLGDRGYCRAPGLAYVQQAGAQYLVRLHSTALPLLHSEGGRVDLLELVRSIQDYQPKEWAVTFRHGTQRWPARLCGLRRSATSAEAEKEQALESARKSRSTASARTLELAGYILVVTSLPPQEASVQEVLELYRLRWQVELAFKRLKSLLQVGNLHTFDPASSRAWLQGKLLTALLIERLLLETKIFSPWGYPLDRIKPLEPVH